MKVGIDSIAVHIPKTYISLTGEWAKRRAPVFSDGDVAKLVSKIEKGVGVTKVATADIHEDIATMAAMAVKKLLEKNGLNLSDIGYLALSTETSIDQSKAASAYVLGMLEESFGVKAPHVGCIEYKFACVGSAYALEAANALIRAKMIEQKYAVVVTTDIAKYDLESVGEYTQGAGAVAMLVGENPRLIELDSKAWPSFTSNERDFYRPNWRQTPIVDGKYSVDVYCNSVEGAFQKYMGSDLTYSDFMAGVDKLLFHLPFPRMAEYASSRLLLPLEKPDVAKTDLREAQKEFRKSDRFKEIFSEKIEKSLRASAVVGNIYTGALYLSLASLVEHSLNDGEDLSGQKAVFNAYGSGASAKVFGGIFSQSWKEGAKALDLKEMEEARVEISFEDYERLHQKEEQLEGQNPKAIGESVIAPKSEFVFDRYGDTNDQSKIDLGYRYYRYER